MPLDFKHLPKIQIFYMALPEVEQPHAAAINGNLITIFAAYDRFHACLRLFDFAGVDVERIRQQFKLGDRPAEYHIAQSWQQIAARDGAMTLWDIAEAINLIRTNLDKCPNLNAMVVRNELEIAIRQFYTSFPDVRKIRDAFAHASKFSGTDFDLNRHSLRGPLDQNGIRLGETATLYLTGIIGRSAAISSFGHLLKYDISNESLQKIEEVYRSLISVFTRAHETTYADYLRKTGIADDIPKRPGN